MYLYIYGTESHSKQFAIYKPSPLSESILQHIPPPLYLVLVVPHILRVVVLMPRRECLDPPALLDPLHPRLGTLGLILPGTARVLPDGVVLSVFAVVGLPVPHDEAPVPAPPAPRAVLLLGVPRRRGAVPLVERPRARQPPGLALQARLPPRRPRRDHGAHVPVDGDEARRHAVHVPQGTVLLAKVLDADPPVQAELEVAHALRVLPRRLALCAPQPEPQRDLPLHLVVHEAVDLGPREPLARVRLGTPVDVRRGPAHRLRLRLLVVILFRDLPHRLHRDLGVLLVPDAVVFRHLSILGFLTLAEDGAYGDGKDQLDHGEEVGGRSRWWRYRGIGRVLVAGHGVCIWEEALVSGWGVSLQVLIYREKVMDKT